MANNSKDSAGSGTRVLGIIWLLVSAALAYPVYTFLVSWGFNEMMAGVLVFIGICLLYDIPYRARVKAEHQLAMQRTQQWR
ncbi:MAG: hypothetical protein JNL78_08760 [Rhodocyclaceae bacterium]|nr:hypothetical protein [Rhodocyclaceae bacterium]